MCWIVKECSTIFHIFLNGPIIVPIIIFKNTLEYFRILYIFWNFLKSSIIFWNAQGYSIYFESSSIFCNFLIFWNLLQYSEMFQNFLSIQKFWNISTIFGNFLNMM